MRIPSEPFLIAKKIAFCARQLAAICIARKTFVKRLDTKLTKQISATRVIKKWALSIANCPEKKLPKLLTNKRVLKHF